MRREFPVGPARAKPTKKENDRAPPWDGTYLTGSSWEISFMEDLVSKRFPGTGISFEIHLSDGSPWCPHRHPPAIKAGLFPFQAVGSRPRDRFVWRELVNGLKERAE